jgi:hypothetical protein
VDLQTLQVCLFMYLLAFIVGIFFRSSFPSSSSPLPFISVCICICIYLRSFDLRKGYCPLDIEHVISIHNTMRYRISNGQELTEIYNL